MGGGDSKFLATFLLLIPVDLQHRYLESLAVGILILGGGLVVYRSLVSLKEIGIFWRTRDWVILSRIYGKKIPFAPIILFSWLAFGYNIGIWEGLVD